MTIQSTLYFSAFFAFLAAGIYLYVGWQLGKRVVASENARLAWQSFTVWWFGLAGTTLISALLNLFGAWGLTDLSLFITANYVNVLILCVALWGLVYYLVYLFTGNSRALVPLAVFYFIFYALVVYYITASTPEAIEVERWRTGLSYRAQLTGPFFTLLILMLLLPQILGGLAYFFLYFRLTEATQKYRTLLVSWSIIIWFLSAFFALAGGLADEDWWQLVSRLIGLIAALTILMAYLPPRWLRQRYGIAALPDENQAEYIG